MPCLGWYVITAKCASARGSCSQEEIIMLHVMFSHQILLESWQLTSLVDDGSRRHRGSSWPCWLINNSWGLLHNHDIWWRIVLLHNRGVLRLDNWGSSPSLLYNRSSSLLYNDTRLSKEGGGVSVEVSCRKASSQNVTRSEGVRAGRKYCFCVGGCTQKCS